MVNDYDLGLFYNLSTMIHYEYYAGVLQFYKQLLT